MHTQLEHGCALEQAQPGLPADLPYVGYITVTLTTLTATDGRAAYDLTCAVARKLVATARHLEVEAHAITAVEPVLWQGWSAAAGLPPVRAITPEAVAALHRVMERSPPFKRSGGHLFFHIKAATKAAAVTLEQTLRQALEGHLAQPPEVCHAAAYREGMVFGRRQLHGLVNPTNRYDFSGRVLIGEEDAAHRGGCFGLTQRFVHDWAAIDNLSEIEIENLNGRTQHGLIIPGMSGRAHIKRVRTRDPHSGLNRRIATQGKPYGNVSAAREEGLFFAGYAQGLEVFTHTLKNMLGNGHNTLDEQLSVTAAVAGNTWYIPSAADLGLTGHDRQEVPLAARFQVRSANGIQYYNTRDFLHRHGRQSAVEDRPLAPRIVTLLGNTFSRWHNNWYHRPTYPDLGHLRDHLPGATAEAREAALTALSIPERKGLSIKLMLGKQLTGSLGHRADVFRIDPEEVIVGVLPPFTLGTGVRVMRYLTDQELYQGFGMSLDETSMAGHITPDYHALCQKGIGGLLAEAQAGLAGAAVDEERRRFYQSVVWALEGARDWFLNYAALARDLRERQGVGAVSRRANLAAIAERMERLALQPPRDLHEAVQLVFGMHCCLHLVGELVSLGRLDQVLNRFHDPASDDPVAAQEVIDAFWIKMDEKVLMNRHFFPDWRTFGTCAVPYMGGGTVPLGDKASQWVMQCTVGGYLPTDDEQPRDGCNPITLMCLRAARRLPLNAPCLSLRVNRQTPETVVAEAALAILSGGAHPFLYDDERISTMLEGFGPTPIPKRWARDWCADGCWEPIFFGATEFGLIYTPATPALECAINEGMTYVNAGPTYLAGGTASFRSPPAYKITSFEEFLAIFYRHYQWMAGSTMQGLVARYGNLWKICPSPLLSAQVAGCLDSGRDLTNGGALHHMLAPQINGVPCVIDSLYAIHKLCFDPASAVCTLRELRQALLCDWGYDMIEPIQNELEGPQRAADRAVRFKHLRQAALNLPKFGRGNAEVDAFGGEVASRLAKIFMDTLERPAEAVSPAFAQALKDLEAKYSLPERPFAFKLVPGFGTFEDYLGLGLSAGASADGRRKGTTLSSNMSAMPVPADLPPTDAPVEIFSALAGWNGATFDYARNLPGPVDIDIPEDFPLGALKEVIRGVGRGELGFNTLTISCADRATLESAVDDPEVYDLLRLRMGGWSELFVSMFPGHQQQHLRRPVYEVKLR